jgi:hypothetical protein
MEGKADDARMWMAYTFNFKKGSENIVQKAERENSKKWDHRDGKQKSMVRTLDFIKDYRKPLGGFIQDMAFLLKESL